MNWTNERIELLKKLWTEGLSASKIATQLGSITRNAVIGKAHRLKLSGRGKITKHDPKVSSHPSCDSHFSVKTHAHTAFLQSENITKHHTKIQKKHGKHSVISISSHHIHITLLQLTESSCRWPLGDPLNEDFHFCGAASEEGSPYCSYHSSIAFQPLTERRRVKF
ncbi:MAG: GcrA cell cycle regulator [Candidatus Tokpelaia sp. JSC161]|jgi:GcrA cell cycle regulator|nr:MAG: GcrA cell cycle regulator [Candidatus Tokpelaia sp. JSC161]